MATTVRKEDRMPGSQPVQKVNYTNRSTAIYGRAGTGKTTLAATWPKPILYLNIRDDGTDSITDVEDIDVKHIHSSEDLQEVILWCAKQQKKGKLIYKTIVADTLSQLQGILVEELCANKKLKKGQNPGDFGTLTKQEWGQIAGDLKAAIWDVRNLGIESVFIAQDRIFNDPADEEDDGLNQLDPEVGPKLMPSVNKDLCASVSIIGNTFIRIKTVTKKDGNKKTKEIVKEYCLRIGPNAVYTTKIRKPKGIELPDYIVDPSFRKLKQMRKGYIEDGKA
jgi:hypothetical protein